LLIAHCNAQPAAWNVEAKGLTAYPLSNLVFKDMNHGWITGSYAEDITMQIGNVLLTRKMEVRFGRNHKALAI